MRIALVICTFMRPHALITLLHSVQNQTIFPDEIIVVDGSLNDETTKVFQQTNFKNLQYFKVGSQHRGLTRQRNYGISEVDDSTEIVCFLDDDTVLEPNYFEEVIKTFSLSDDIIGVGGIAINENRWKKKNEGFHYDKYKYFEMDGYVYPEAQRNIVRNYLGLQADVAPGIMPQFSHGRTCGFPIDGRIFEVDLLIGMSMSFRKKIFDSIKFSEYFSGYSLYEDADFSIRALAFGKNVINTNVQLSHFHCSSGRPNYYLYGKMVVRNGWYVWRVKNPKPKLKDRVKWNAITILLTGVRLSNAVNSKKKLEAITEAVGRIVGWCSLIVNKPQ